MTGDVGREVGALRMQGPFAEFGLEGDPGEAGEAFWEAARERTTPVVVPGAAGGWTALLLWRGGPARVCFESWSEPVELTRWAGSDCWYARVAMPERLRVTYWFETDGDDDGDADRWADPRNPAAAGVDRSIAATPDAEAQPHWPVLGPDDVSPLPRTRIRWTSARLGGRRTVRVHQAGAHVPDGPGPHPVVLLLDGDDWLHLHPAVTAFDAAVAAGEMPAATLVFLPTAGDREAELAAGSGLWAAVREELLGLLAENGIAVGPGRLVVAGQSYGGLAALRAALDHPDLVTRVACQSGSFWWPRPAGEDPLGGPTGGEIAARLRDRAPDLSGLRVAFDVGEHEAGMLPHCALVESLVAEAGATVRVSRSTSGHDRAGWRHPLVRDVAWALGDEPGRAGSGGSTGLGSAIRP